MFWDPQTWALAIPAVIFAGISKSGFGSGAAFAASSVLALVVDPGVALGIMLPLLMLIDVASLKPYWGKWDFRDCVKVILGSIPGVALGAWIYAATNADLLRFFIGAISILFVIWQLIRSSIFEEKERNFKTWVAVVTGATAGFTSFVSHAGGPPVAVYMLSRGISKLTYQANSILIFWAINWFKFVPYTFLGIFTLETMVADMILAPFALFGAWLGVRAHHVVPEKLFRALTYVMLFLTGGKLIYDALT